MPSKVKTIFDADVQKALDKTQRMLLKQQEQIQKLRTMNRESKKAKDGFVAMTGAAMDIAKSIPGIAAVTAALLKTDAAAKAAGESLLLQEQTRQSLAQIQTDPKIADRLAKDIGVSVITAQRTLFKGVSAGFTPDQVSELSGLVRPIVGAEQIADFFNLIQQQQIQFGAPAGSPLEIFNRLLAGATVSPLNVEELGPESAKTFAALTSIGSTPAEAVAASSFAPKGQNASEAVTAIRALGTALSKDRSKVNLGLTGGIEAVLAEFGGDVKEAQLSFTNVRARTGFSILAKNMAAFKTLIADIETAVGLTGTDESPLNLARAAAAADPRLRAILIRRKTQAGVEVAEQDRGVREELQESAFSIAKAARIRQLTIGTTTRSQLFIESIKNAVIDAFVDDPSFTATLLRRESRELFQGTPEAQAENNRILNEMNQQLINLANNAAQIMKDIRNETRIVPNNGVE